MLKAIAGCGQVARPIECARMNFPASLPSAVMQTLRNILCSAAIVAFWCCGAWAAAEDAPRVAASSGVVEEIVVTGSRIRRDVLEAEDLILGLDAESGRVGRKSLGDMLATLPVSGSPLSTRFNSSGNFGFPADGGGVAAGASQVDLRHLGAKRVLVLVDGLRWVHGASGSGVSGATDLNTLPASVVERVEVSLDGASSIYGSDAIAGVVNIVTAGAEGFSAKLHGGGYANGGAARGFEFAFGRERGGTSVSLHLSHVDQQAVSAADHEQTRYPFPNTGTRHGSTFTPQGRVIFTDPNTGTFVNCALDVGVVGLPTYDPAAPCEADDYHPWSNADRFNYAAYNLTLTPSKRSGAFARLEHRLTDSLEVYLRLLGNNRRSVNQAAPEPLWAGPLAPSGSVLDDIVIAADNPYNPFGFDLATGSWATRRPLESGPRVFKQDVDTRYGATGLRGTWTLGQRAFYWDFNLLVARNVARQVKHGAHNARRMLVALGPPETCAATPGCVPLNLLGGQGDGAGTITEAMLDWIGFTQRDFSDQTLRDRTFNIAGDLALLPAGDMAFAAGFERRTQRGRFRPDPVVAAGDTAGLPAQPTAGEQVATEWYGEVEAPLLAGAPGRRTARRFRCAAALRVRQLRQRPGRPHRAGLATGREPAAARQLGRRLPGAEHRRTLRRRNAPRRRGDRPLFGLRGERRRASGDRPLHRCRGCPRTAATRSLAASSFSSPAATTRCCRRLRGAAPSR